jgi:transketolase
MPCREWFDAQTPAYREKVLPAAVRARVSVEAGVPQGWRDIVGDAGEIIGIDHFGASADAVTLFREFGFTPAAVVAAAKKSLKTAKGK